MNENPNEAGRFARFFEEKGFYIILFLCVAAIGIAGYVLFFEQNEPETEDLLAAETDLQEDAEPSPAGSFLLPAIDVTDAPQESAARPASLPDAAEEAEPADAEPAPAGTAAEKAASAAEERDAVIREAVETIAETRTEKPAEKAPAEEEPVKDAAPTFFVRPLNGEVLRGFSGDELVYERTMGDWRTHNGVDIASFDGALVSAVADGVVEDVYHDEYYGTGVLVDHGGGLKSVYLGLIENATVEPGQKVSAGDTIGAVSASALFESLEQVHLHLEMTQDGARVDPLGYIPA